MPRRRKVVFQSVDESKGLATRMRSGYRESWKGEKSSIRGHKDLVTRLGNCSFRATWEGTRDQDTQPHHVLVVASHGRVMIVRY
jgi:hypothetical protein